MNPPPIWDRDLDGPGVLRYAPLAEAIERMPMEEFALLLVALAREAREKADGPSTA